MELELLKMLPGSGVGIALIIVVMLFLKQNEKSNQALKDITDKFNSQTAMNQKNYQDQLNTLTAQGYANQKNFQDQMNQVIDDHMKVTRETIIAVQAVESTVRQLEITVRDLKDRRA